MKIIKAKSNKMKINPKTGQRIGWHTFTKGAIAKIEYRAQICQTVLVVKSGPDKGLYVP